MGRLSLEKGIGLFNRGEYFEAHEAWERVWRGLADYKERRFVQSLTMIAAALYHYKRKEYRGCEKLLIKGITRLKETLELGEDMEIKKFLHEVREFEHRFLRGDPVPEEDFPLIEPADVRASRAARL